MKEKLALFLGSKSDVDKLNPALRMITEEGVSYRLNIVSAHRNPDKLRTICKKIESQGVEVAIAAAGLAAALPGFIAAYVNIPVIGVPLTCGSLGGIDSILSIVQVPRGLGLVVSGMDNRGLINAFIFALEIISLKDENYRRKLVHFKNKFRK